MLCMYASDVWNVYKVCMLRMLVMLCRLCMYVLYGMRVEYVCMYVSYVCMSVYYGCMYDRLRYFVNCMTVRVCGMYLCMLCV